MLKNYSERVKGTDVVHRWSCAVCTMQWATDTFDTDDEVCPDCGERDETSYEEVYVGELA